MGEGWREGSGEGKCGERGGEQCCRGMEEGNVWRGEGRVVKGVILLVEIYGGRG